MALITVLYARSLTIGGLLIRHRDPYGRWSHAAVDTGEGTVIEARFFQGVTETPLEKFLLRYGDRRLEAHGIDCPDPAAGIAWARQQVGKPYDWRSVVGLGLRLSWQEEDSWQCAELVEAALLHAGRARFRSAPYRITPNISWMAR
jgi:uncharacterized protein YycO